MKNVSLFTKSFKFLVRLSSICVLWFVIFRLIRVIFFNENFYVYTENCIIPKIVMFLIYEIDAFILIFLIFVPTQFYLFGVMAVIYSATVFIDQPQNNMEIPIFLTGFLVLALTGFFSKKGKIKTISFVILFILLNLSEIRFGTHIFIVSVFSKILFFFTVMLILLIPFHLSLGKPIFTSDKVLDLSAFPDLTIRDIEWIKLILRETKYETIARKYNLSEGTVKNNFARIFKILNVGDRIHFMAVYGGCKVLNGDSNQTKVLTFLKDVFFGQIEKKGV